MSLFDPQLYMVEPSESTFKPLRKDDLITLGKHLKLEVRSSTHKREIQKLIIEHLVNVTQSFEPSILKSFVATQQPSQLTTEADNHNSVESMTREKGYSEENREREKQWQREQEEIAWQKERERREWKVQKAREEREFRLKEQEIEIKKTV